MHSDMRETLKTMSLDALSDLSDDIADFLANQTRYDVDTVLKSIHSIETTLALHYVFNSNRDRFVFDDIAQIMVHKMLTGRSHELKLRNDMPLTLSRDNIHDAYMGGEVGEGLGVALSYAIQKNGHVICVVDDYALNYGVTYEVLVQISRTNPNMTIVLIEEQQSLLRHYTSLNAIIKSVRISKTYTGIKKDMKMMLDSNPLSRPLYNTLVKMRDAVKETIIEPTIFKQFGIEYHGPIDGQNIGDLIRSFELVKTLKGPNIIHVQTRLRAKTRRKLNFPAFKTDSSLPENYRTYHEAFDDVLSNNADAKTMLLVDSIYFGDYFAKFEGLYPDNYKMTTGSPEALVTMASGYAMQGYKVILALSATDIVDALVPLRNQFLNASIPLTLLLRNAGLSNTPAATKQGIYDVDALIHDFNIYNPRDIQEASLLLGNALNNNNLNIIRYQNNPEMPKHSTMSLDTEWELLAPIDERTQTLILTSGISASHFLDKIKSNGLNIGLVHCRNISKVDTNIMEMIVKHNVPCYIYYVDSKTNAIYQTVSRYLMLHKKTLDIKLFDLENVNVNNSAGPIKRDNHLRIDDVLRSIIER